MRTKCAINKIIYYSTVSYSKRLECPLIWRRRLESCGVKIVISGKRLSGFNSRVLLLMNCVTLVGI